VSKLREDLRVGILGAAAGLFSISVALLIGRIDAYYAYLSWLREANHYAYYEKGVEGLWWMPVFVWHTLLSVMASLLVHRYLITRVRSPFLLWQVIGLASLLGWGLTFVLTLGMECVAHGNLSSLEYPLRHFALDNIAKYVSAVFACNVLYGSVIKASSQQYTEQFDLN
jgi:hypothetical protein